MVTLILRQCVSTAAHIIAAVRPLATACAATAAARSVTGGAAVVGVLLASAPFFNAFAADASAWDGDAHAAMRLIAGGGPNDKPPGGPEPLQAGVELRLADGWKTYWRYPGDSGVPPVFDFSKSDNIKSVSILWPAPHRFTYDGGASIGYKGDVVFPVHVVPEDPARPVTLRLALEYAVCEKYCAPMHGDAELALASSRASSPHASRIAAAEALTPRPASIGDAAPLGIPLGVTDVRREAGEVHPRIVVEVAAPPDAPLDLFAEGPNADWALPLPEPIPGAPTGRRWFAFDLDGAPPGVDGTGAPLRFTLVSDENAVEVTAVPK
jgi:DsbC/DsbD-like thiol-disulfide interchange protein